MCTGNLIRIHKTNACQLVVMALEAFGSGEWKGPVACRPGWRNDRATVFIPGLLASPFKSKSVLEAENVALRHQLIVLRRKVQGRVRLTNNDRWFFIQQT